MQSKDSTLNIVNQDVDSAPEDEEMQAKSSSADSSLEESEQCDYPMQYEEFKEFESIANKNESNMKLDKLRIESETPL